MRHEGKLAFINPTNAPTRILFKCPGCKETHWVDSSWTWNGSTGAPTFAPSVHVKNADGSTTCHSFVQDGRIQFLSDCQHDMRRMTVPLPEWDVT